MAKKKVEVIKKKSAPAKTAPAKEKRVFKTKRVLSGMQKVFRKWGDWEVDDFVVGKFIATHEDNYDKTNYVIEVIAAEFQDGSGEEFLGKNLVLNSSGTLNKAFEEIQTGEFVQVTYLGKSEITKGKYAGKEAHNMEIIVVEDPDALEETEEEEEEYDEEDEDSDDL
jgi:hypothetical protein